ncbi:Gluconate permease [Salmonella enterica subsp. enterica]|uniref:Gluconate permease n=1 Tax=Salmonella enterica I TaxID=59201 RepID=A0A447TNX8_SALET|nr:Gluconate permease [Salmonella enterica subsp. enterica]
MLGRLISDTGAAQRIATTLINTFGKKRVQWALVITGLIVGLAMFFEVGIRTAVAARFYDCGLIGTALAVCRGSNGRRLIRYSLLPAAASRPYRYCDNF